MAHGRQSPETVSKKKTIFFANGEVFFLTYFLIGASGGPKSVNMACCW